MLTKSTPAAPVRKVRKGKEKPRLLTLLTPRSDHVPTTLPVQELAPTPALCPEEPVSPMETAAPTHTYPKFIRKENIAR